MGKYKPTNRAENEIEDIYEYSILNYGTDTAREYVSGLHEKFEVLAENQGCGNDYAFIKSGLRRYEYRSHSIYYPSSWSGILIVRVLGNRQDPARHF